MSGGPEGARWWLVSQLRLLLAEGKAEEALNAVEQLKQIAGWFMNPAVAPWRSLKAQGLERVGRRDQALALAEEELDLARQFGAPGALGRTLRVLGTIERERGFDHLREAVDVAGKRVESREPLREALDLAHRCGARGLAERTREELVAAGAKPRRAALRGVGALTPSELRVARLAAQGLANREIAQSLYVTIRTVQGHLSHVYDKLDVSSREELPGALGEALESPSPRR